MRRWRVTRSWDVEAETAEAAIRATIGTPHQQVKSVAAEDEVRSVTCVKPECFEPPAAGRAYCGPHLKEHHDLLDRWADHDRMGRPG